MRHLHYVGLQGLEVANHFKIPAVGKALESEHGMQFQLEWSPTPGKAPEMQTVTYAPPTYIGCVPGRLLADSGAGIGFRYLALGNKSGLY